MTTIELLKSVKNSIYTAIALFFEDIKSKRMQMVWTSLAIYIVVMLYALQHNSPTISTCVTAASSVFTISLSAYVGSNMHGGVYKNQVILPSQTNSTSKDLTDPDEQEA